MLRPIRIDVVLFSSDDPRDLDRSRKALCALMLGLALANFEFLRSNPRTPPLYQSGVLYRRENKTEHWADVPTMLKRGFGDCEDLACWRIAEHMTKGVRATPYITWRKSGPDSTIIHAVLKLPNGKIEDPSRALGMSGNPVYRPVYIRAVDQTKT